MSKGYFHFANKTGAEAEAENFSTKYYLGGYMNV